MGGLTSVFQDSEGNPARFLAIFLWLSFLFGQPGKIMED